jgi:hypothetical protein
MTRRYGCSFMTLAAEKIGATAPLEDGARALVINSASLAAYDGQVGQAASRRLASSA